jgi:hypothetical protein
MKRLMTVALLVISQNGYAQGLTDALSKAIQNSDTEKASTKVVLLVNDAHIEKATFKRGQSKHVIKDESTVIADSTYQAPEAERRVYNDDGQLESIANEMKHTR